MNEQVNNTFDLEEIRRIEDFCDQANTQVLYLMIVQMIGFTRESEDKLDITIQDLFNKLIASKIDEYKALQLKQKNRSFLIAFPDATSAVKAALNLQFIAVDSNSNNGIKLEIKIGIHAGQALVNDQFNKLIFTNHINYTSSLENLTQVGHIYLTEHVYTGATNWLNQQSAYNIVHKKHGNYFLPEVKEHADIYEVSNKKIQNLEPPKAEYRKIPVSFRRKIVYTVLLFFVVLFLFNKCKTTSVYLKDFPQDEVYLNHNNKQLTMAEYEQDEYRKINKKFKKGKYVLYYDTNSSIRYYASINVKKGKNEINPRFRKQKLPRLQKTLVLDSRKGSEDVVLGNGRWNYSIYNRNNTMISHDAEFNVSIRGEVITEKEYVYTVRWRFDMDGGKVSSEQKVYSSDIQEIINFHKDKLHFIDLEINIKDNKANIALISVFADYKK